jgi:cytochrome c oxidase subunit III
MIERRRVIDASKFPQVGWDVQAPIWWGNLLLLIIETAMFAIVIASYFYVRMNFEAWPPPRVNREPILYNSDPDLLWGTINAVVLVALCYPARLMDQAARKLDNKGVIWTTIAVVAMGLISCGLRWKEFGAMHFSWDDNAYGSVVWMLLGTHLLHIIVATVETGMMLAFVGRHKLDEKHAVDITTSTVYWYWVSGTWLFIYALIYFGARVL